MLSNSRGNPARRQPIRHRRGAPPIAGTMLFVVALAASALIASSGCTSKPGQSAPVGGPNTGSARACVESYLNLELHRFRYVAQLEREKTNEQIADLLAFQRFYHDSEDEKDGAYKQELEQLEMLNTKRDFLGNGNNWGPLLNSYKYEYKKETEAKDTDDHVIIVTVQVDYQWFKATVDDDGDFDGYELEDAKKIQRLPRSLTQWVTPAGRIVFRTIQVNGHWKLMGEGQPAPEEEEDNNNAGD